MMVLYWLTISLSSRLAQSILWIGKASDVYDDLRNQLSQNDIFRFDDLQEEIQNLKQYDLSVIDYFTKLKILWDEFLILRRMLLFTCNPRCYCGVVEVHKRHIDQDLCH